MVSTEPDTGLVAVAGGRVSALRPAAGRGMARRRGNGAAANGSGRAGVAFVSGYAVLLLLFGVAPGVYAAYLALTTANGHFTWFANFVASGEDFRFLTAFRDVAVYLIEAAAGAFNAVTAGVLYYQLRVAKEGVDIERIASVFD